MIVRYPQPLHPLTFSLLGLKRDQHSCHFLGDHELLTQLQLVLGFDSTHPLAVEYLNLPNSIACTEFDASCCLVWSFPTLPKYHLLLGRLQEVPTCCVAYYLACCTIKPMWELRCPNPPNSQHHYSSCNIDSLIHGVHMSIKLGNAKI